MIRELYEDEAFVIENEFDISIPFAVVQKSGSDGCEIDVYPSMRAYAEAFLKRFEGASRFSPQALLWARNAVAPFLEMHGYEIGGDSDDYYRIFVIDDPSADVILPTTQMLSGVGKCENLTEYDIDALCAFGYMCFGTVIDGKIVSAACTNEPVSDAKELGDIEIGVETSSLYGGKGYGASNVAALTKALIKNGGRAVYECASKNTASVRLAEKLGGVEYARKFYIVGLKNN